MRFSTSLLAASLSALALSFPVDRDRDVECDWHPVMPPTYKIPEPPTNPHKATYSSSIVSSYTVSIPASPPTNPHKATYSSSIVSSYTVSIPASPPTIVPSATLLASSMGNLPAVERLRTSSSTIMPSSTTTAPKSSSSTAARATSTSKSGALQWVGANESGAEFGGGKIPGTLGTDYIFPDTSAIQTLMNKGMNIFRIPFLMERLAPGTMTSALDTTYLSELKTVVSFITAAGAHAVLDPHNFGRYYGTVFTSTSDFKTFWTNLATEFKANDKVIFDCNNEFHDEPSNALVVALNQACIDGVRAAGATTQYIFVEGTVSAAIPLIAIFVTSR